MLRNMIAFYHGANEAVERTAAGGADGQRITYNVIKNRLSDVLYKLRCFGGRGRPAGRQAAGLAGGPGAARRVALRSITMEQRVAARRRFWLGSKPRAGPGRRPFLPTPLADRHAALPCPARRAALRCVRCCSSQKFEDPADGEEAIKQRFQALNDEIRDRFRALEEVREGGGRAQLSILDLVVLEL